ncbi:MAG: cadherin-like beta sandwich domain-containing protein, partial [Spirochaetota bacterium]
SSNADLASLSLEEAEISPEFDPDTQSYTATVEYVIDSVTVAAAVAEDVATIQSGLGSHDLLVGSNDIDVVVQAEDMSTQEYTIEITREAAITRTFRARDVADETWYDVPATLLGSGDHALVFVEDESGVTIDTAAAVADEFDENIYDLIRESFAHEPDVDENGKVILLLLDIIDGYSGSGGYVAGYFDPTHLFETSTYANSNEADMIFVDVNPGEPASDAFYTTVAHEFQHLVNFAATYFDDETQQDTWINEGLSSASEYLYAGDHIESRIAYYNSDPLGTIGQGNNFYIWDGYWENFVGDQLANYSTVYLFFQWLRIHASNDALIYGEILSSSHRDYRTVLDAAQQRVDPSLSTWESVLGAWFQANLLSMDEGSGLQGYRGEIETMPWNFLATGGLEWNFSSGEGFVVQTEGDSFTYPGGSGSDIRYVGVDLTTHAIDATGPTYDGDCVIVFNSSTLIDLTDPSQVGVLPRVASPALSLLPSVQSNPAAMPESYPIDIQLQPGGGFAPDSHRPGERARTFEPFERRGR